MVEANRYSSGPRTDGKRCTVLNGAINVIFRWTKQDCLVGANICTTSNVSTFEFAIVASLNETDKNRQV